MASNIWRLLHACVVVAVAGAARCDENWRCRSRGEQNFREPSVPLGGRIHYLLQPKTILLPSSINAPSYLPFSPKCIVLMMKHFALPRTLELLPGWRLIMGQVISDCQFMVSSWRRRGRQIYSLGTCKSIQRLETFVTNAATSNYQPPCSIRR